MHSTPSLGPPRKCAVALFVFALLASACSSGGWQEMPEPPIDGRGFAGSACSESGLIVWGGATVREVDSSDPEIVMAEIFADGAIFDVARRDWRVLPSGPLTARWGAAATIDGNNLLVWGGAGSVISSLDPTDFDYPTDGAILDLSTMEWTYLPEGPLRSRFDGAAVSLSGPEVFIYGGQATPGTDTSTLNAAFLNVTSLQFSVAQSPPIDSVVFADHERLLAIDSAGVYEYATALDEWTVTSIEVPVDMGDPIAVVPIEDGTKAVVVSTSGSWTYEKTPGFVRLEASPIIGSDVQLRSSSSGATIWDPASRSAWVLRDGTWEPLPTPRRLGTREGSSVCQTLSTLIIWGGQEDRDTVHLTRSDGMTIQIER